jgi:hypothetical protein
VQICVSEKHHVKVLKGKDFESKSPFSGNVSQIYFVLFVFAGDGRRRSGQNGVSV